MPGAPPMSTSEPGTSPPPSTRSSSPMPVARRRTATASTSRRARTAPVRAALAGPRATRSSAIVFQAPQPGHRPCHLGSAWPHSEQRKEVRARAISMSVGSEQDTFAPMLTGAHAILFAQDADAARAFLRDVLGFESVDAGRGWLIFALPPSELGIHPAEGDSSVELYLMCDDVESEVKRLVDGGAKPASELISQRWGRMMQLIIPGDVHIGIYEPLHPTALKLAIDGAAKYGTA